jgi:hypothetical protein
MTNPNRNRILAAMAISLTAAACGPSFDPPSLVDSTRVLGARVEVAGAPERATPAPGESATVTWLMSAPGAMPSLGWAFALCARHAPNDLTCTTAPMAVYQGTENPPRVSIQLPAAEELGGSSSLLLYGRICAGGSPAFDPQTGYPTCADGAAAGTTATAVIAVAGAGVDPNQNPVADRGLTFDGQPWPPLAGGDDPCAGGPTVSAGTDDHQIALATAGDDRERYTALYGDPPAPTALRESLQVSQFATAGKLRTAFTFVESDVADDAPPASVKWNAPARSDVVAPTPVAFTFVVRDSRGGTDWTTRAACVVP